MSEPSFDMNEKGYVDSGIFRDPTPDALAYQFLSKLLEESHKLESQRKEGFTESEVNDAMLALDSLPARIDTELEKLKQQAESEAHPYVEENADEVALAAVRKAMPGLTEAREISDLFLSLVRAFKGPFVLKEDAPPSAMDATMMLKSVERLKSAIAEEHLFLAVYYAMNVGYLKCKLDVRPAERYARDGKRLVTSRRMGGLKSGRATAEEKQAIATAVRVLAREREWPVTRAIKDIAAQLRTGRFPGIDRNIDYSDGYLADLVRNA